MIDFPRYVDVWRTVAALACAVLLAGCALTRAAPVKETFLLDPAVPAVAAQPRPGTLRVGVMTVAGAFRDRTFVMRLDDVRYATDYYNEYVTPPAPMLAELTSQALGRAHVFARVTAPGTPAEADYVLDGFVNALYADRRSKADLAAEVAVTFYLSQADTGSNVPFWTKQYHQRVQYQGDSADAYVRAQNTALTTILGELARDLAALQLPPPAP